MKQEKTIMGYPVIISEDAPDAMLINNKTHEAVIIFGTSYIQEPDTLSYRIRKSIRLNIMAMKILLRMWFTK